MRMGLGLGGRLGEPTNPLLHGFFLGWYIYSNRNKIATIHSWLFLILENLMTTTPTHHIKSLNSFLTQPRYSLE